MSPSDLAYLAIWGDELAVAGLGRRSCEEDALDQADDGRQPK
ncbi:MAG: hypothetical protein QOJ73_1178, partial [Streptosporangiaceae bacterium]|nr:hypothetical protein [Streptosporangiaceae bacterium]